MTAKKKKTDKRVNKVRAASSASVDYRVFKALAHPLRIEILAILNDRMASPNELRKELEEGLSQVSYHIKVLRDFQMIEQVKTEPRRGAVEHYYKATEKVFITAEQLKLMPKSAQRGVWGPVLSDIEEDLNTSMRTETFARRPDLVVGRGSTDPRRQGPRRSGGSGCRVLRKIRAARGRIGPETPRRRGRRRRDMHHRRRPDLRLRRRQAPQNLQATQGGLVTERWRSENCALGF